jgi:hypothetical protein
MNVEIIIGLIIEFLAMFISNSRFMDIKLCMNKEWLCRQSIELLDCSMKKVNDFTGVGLI